MNRNTTKELELLRSLIGDRYIAYSHLTEFVIQRSRSRNPKSGYKIHQVTQGNLGRALLLYDMLELDPKYRKRIVSLDPNSKRTVILHSKVTRGVVDRPCKHSLTSVR